MRKFLAILYLLLVCVGNGYAQGVDVYKRGDIYNALDYAKRQRKLLLVEFYAPWSHQSVWFNEMMNSSSDLIKALDDNFVVFQFDTKTDVGADFANRYSVNGYPLLLVFNRNGDVIYKIDKTLEPADFIETLNTVIMQQNGSVVWKIAQLDAAIENQDYTKADEVFGQLYKSVENDIFNRHYWRFFEDKTVTFFQSNSYNVLTDNRDKFETDSLIVDNRIKNIIRGLIMPFLIQSQPLDSVAIKIIKDEIVRLKLNDEQSYVMLEMIDNRNAKNVGKYLQNCEHLLNMMDEDMGFSIILTLDFIADYGSKDQCSRAKKIVEYQMQKSPLGSQIDLLEHLLTKF